MPVYSLVLILLRIPSYFCTCPFTEDSHIPSRNSDPTKDTKSKTNSEKKQIESCGILNKVDLIPWALPLIGIDQ